MGVEVRATTTVLTAFRTTVSPNKIPPPGPPVAIAAQVAAIGRLGLQLAKAGRGVAPLFTIHLPAV